jgi:hypothetical protein
MPHTSDRSRRAARRRITHEPAHLAASGLPQREHPIAMPAGQKVLQSVLMRVFANSGYHCWDPLKGRRLAGLFDYYGTWVSPQPDRIVMGSTVAHRMCGYLLPYTDSEEAQPHCAGIPGLRLDSCARFGYRLTHLPTATTVEIHDDCRWSPHSREDLLATERRMHRGEEESRYRPVWREPALSDVEQRWETVWQLQPHTELASALFCLQAAFLHDPASSDHSSDNWARHLQLACPDRIEEPSVMTWCSGLRPGQVGGHIEALGLAATGATRTQEAGANYATMALNGVTLEMHRRRLCTRCHSDRTFAPSRPARVAA